MYRLAVLVSGNGSNLQAIIDAIAGGELAAEVAVVVSNVEGAYALERAAAAGVPTVLLTPQPGEARAEYDADVFGVEIRINIRLAEAPEQGQTVFQYDPAATGAAAYRLAAEELLLRADDLARRRERARAVG